MNKPKLGPQTVKTIKRILILTDDIAATASAINAGNTGEIGEDVSNTLINTAKSLSDIKEELILAKPLFKEIGIDLDAIWNEL